ncbi:MAG: hypothetical protein LBI67_01395 [Treponema sp.]|jgi:hypothetical protein|nr:hypothetical protein [Treponema sp.]
MKKIAFFAVCVLCSWAAVAEPLSVPVKIASYLISRRQTAAQYEKADLVIDDETQSWEIVLYRKDGADNERIKLEKFEDIGNNNGVFRTITIQENSKTSGSGLFAYMPVFNNGKIQVDLCDTRTEGVRRRLILEL